MFVKILTANRGLVLVADQHSHDRSSSSKIEANTSGVTVTCFIYKPDTAKFVRCGESYLDIAAKQILTCSIIEDNHTSIVLPCLLIEMGKDNDATLTQRSSRTLDKKSNCFENLIVSFLPEVEELVVAGSCFTSTLLSKSNIWLLDGPTICWECSGNLNVARIKPDDESKKIFSTEQIPHHLWSSEHALKWCDVINGDLIAMATHPVMKKNESVNLWFDDLCSQRKWTMLKCPKVHTDESYVISDMSKIPIIPDTYASSINCIYIDRDNHTPVNFKDQNILSEISILAVTTQSQLLEFRSSRVRQVCELPFSDADAVLVVTRTDGSDLVMVRSESGCVCAVEQKTFKILQQWEHMSTILVDDFLFSGSEQVLMVPKNSPNAHPLQGFVLTDLAGCHVNDKEDTEADKVIGDLQSASGESLLSAIHALQTRVQSGMKLLREAESKCEDRSELIKQSQHALHQMVNGREDIMSTKDQNHLVCMYDGCMGQTSVTKVTDKDTVLHNLAVCKAWQRVVDSTWVVGVTVHNKLERKMQDIHLNLIPVSGGSNVQTEMQPFQSECRVMYPVEANMASHNSLAKETKVTDPTEPKAKKTRPNTTNDTLGDKDGTISWLCPGEHTEMVAIATLPEFAGHSAACCDMVLQWKESDSGNAVTVNNEGHWSERLKSCGRVWLSAGDLVKGDHSVELASASKSRTAEQLHQDIQALNAIQMSTVLSVSSLHSHLHFITKALQCTMGFISYALHDGLVCPSMGVLWGVRTRLEVNNTCHGRLTVWTKDKKQLIMFCHRLYQLLPDDITIRPLCPPLSHLEESVTQSIQSMKRELTIQVTELLDIQSTAFAVHGHDPEIKEEPMDIVTSEERSEISEEAKKLLDVRKQFELDRLKFNDLKNLTVGEERLKEIEVVVSGHKQRTDASVRELAKNMMYISTELNYN